MNKWSEFFSFCCSLVWMCMCKCIYLRMSVELPNSNGSINQTFALWLWHSIFYFFVVCLFSIFLVCMSFLNLPPKNNNNQLAHEKCVKCKNYFVTYKISQIFVLLCLRFYKHTTRDIVFREENRKKKKTAQIDENWINRERIVRTIHVPLSLPIEP